MQSAWKIEHVSVHSQHSGEVCLDKSLENPNKRWYIPATRDGGKIKRMAQSNVCRDG